jgi:ribonuclease PH
MLALLATPSIPLRSTVSAIEVVKAQGVPICHPTEGQRRQATSNHVLVFDTNSREIVLCESWGEFTVEEWDEIVDAGEKDTDVDRLMKEEVRKLVGMKENGA